MSKGSVVKHQVYGQGTVMEDLGTYALVDFQGVEGTKTLLKSTLREVTGPRVLCTA